MLVVTTCPPPPPCDPGVTEHQAQTEEQSQAARLGRARPLAGGRIILVEYDSTWPALYEQEAALVRAVLGDTVRLLEHVGSTSVPGLVAKAIVDMLLAVPDSSDEPTYVPPLERASYVLRIREPDWHQHRVFKGPGMDINLHVFSDGCPEIERMLLFRDCLRSNPDACGLYAGTKRELAKQTWQYAQKYADAKTTVVEGIIAQARGSSPHGSANLV